MRISTLKRGKKKAKNFWIGQTVPKIPLGQMLDIYSGEPLGDIAWMRYPIHEGKLISDSILVCGGTGSGKSVTANVILYFLSLSRPVIDFDWAGEDSHRIYYPNSRPHNLPPHTPPSGIRAKYLYYPSSLSRPRKNYERVVRPNLSKYNQAQLEAIGFSPGAAMYLKNIIRRYGPFKSLSSLYEFIEYFPYNDTTSKQVRTKIKRGKLVLKHNKVYRSGDTINAQSKESIKKVLPGLMDRKIFRLDDKQEIPFKEWFMAGENMVFSFNDKLVGRVEIHYWMEQIQRLRKRYKDSPRYFVKIEEAHKVLETNKQKLDEVIEDFILVCRKLNIGLILVMPEVINLSKRVLADIKNIVTGKFKGENSTALISVLGGDARAKTIPKLKYNRYRNEREMLVHNQDYETFFRFRPYNSPSEIKHEV